jgi:uncharacterized protein
VTITRGRVRAVRALCAALALVSTALVLGGLLPGARAEPRPAPRPTPRPLLWKIAGSPASYLYGTIHVPDARVVTWPAAVQRALEASAAVYTELPLDAPTQMRAIQAMALPAGKTLAQVLPDELYQRTERFLQARGLPIAPFQRQKVWMLAAVLPLLDHLGKGEALDQQIYDWAARSGKRTGGLETIDVQVAAMESAGPAGERALLASTLDYLEAAAAAKRDPTAELIDVYLGGDEERIALIAYAYVDRQDAVLGKLLDALIDRRNDGMTARIAELLAADPKSAHFFAVGALHYPGPRGLLAQLRSRGMEITRVE